MTSLKETRFRLGWVIINSALIFALGLLTACGGSSSSSSPSGSGTSTSVGTITALGSITVNGVKYETDSANVTMDGQASDDSSLQVGMVVEVQGTVNADGATGTANAVQFDDIIEGPVLTMNPDGTLSVLGQNVFTDDQTFFVDAMGQPLAGGIDALTIGSHVEISGQWNAAGDLHATYVRLKSGSGSLEVKGFIDAVLSDQSFQIGSLTVEYGAATLKEYPAGATPAAGDFVEVKGSAFDKSSMILTATSVELEDGYEDCHHFEAEGYVTSGNGDSFTLMTPAGTVSVATSATTFFVHGDWVDVVPGAKVEAEGRMVNDVLEAYKVELEAGLQLAAVGASVDPDDPMSLTLAAFPDIKVTVNAATELKEEREPRQSTNDPAGFLATISPTDYVKVRGRLSRDGTTLVATELEVKTEDSPKVKLQCQVEAIDGRTLTMFGVTVDASQAYKFQDRQENRITEDEFWALCWVGTVIEVEGTFSDEGILIATELELED